MLPLGLFILSFVCATAMGYMSSQDSSLAWVNWVDQGINTISHLCLMIGVIILHKNGLAAWTWEEKHVLQNAPANWSVLPSSCTRSQRGKDLKSQRYKFYIRSFTIPGLGNVSSMEAPGFLLMPTSFIIGFGKINRGGVLAAITGLPSILFFLARIELMGFMDWYRKNKFKNDDAHSNQTAQIINAVGQTCLLLGILFA